MMEWVFTRGVQRVDLLHKNVRWVPRARFVFSRPAVAYLERRSSARRGRTSELAGILGHLSIGAYLACWLFRLPRGFEWPFNDLLLSSAVAVRRIKEPDSRSPRPQASPAGYPV